MEALKTIEKNGLILKIFQDEVPDSSDPRDWDNLGTIVAFHRRYDLGDKHSFSDEEAVLAHIEETGAVALPVFMYDHSGISLSTSNAGYPFNCEWDSGQVGVIFVEKAKILEAYAVKELTDDIRSKVIACLKGEIKVYSQYLNGEVYGYTIERKVAAGTSCPTCHHAEPEHLEDIDSCWGFIGEEHVESEAMSMLDHALKNQKGE